MRLDWRDRKRLMAMVIILLVVLLYWIALPGTGQPPHVYDSMAHLPREVAQSGKFYPLPFDNAEPLSGRPEVPMPIPRSIYSKVELKINGRRVESKLITLSAGDTVHVEGKIFGQSDLPQQVKMDGGISVVTRASNDLGWMIHRPQFFGGKMQALDPRNSESQRYCSFEGDYSLPEQTGEYLLVVVSSAYLGLREHPALLAAEFPLDLE